MVFYSCITSLDGRGVAHGDPSHHATFFRGEIGTDRLHHPSVVYKVVTGSAPILLKGNPAGADVCDTAAVLAAIKSRIATQFGIDHATAEIEED